MSKNSIRTICWKPETTRKPRHGPCVIWEISKKIKDKSNLRLLIPPHKTAESFGYFLLASLFFCFS